MADSVCQWTPRAPVRLYYAEHDEQADTRNTQRCRDSFATHGRQVKVVDLGTPDMFGSRHIGSGVAGTAAAVGWFQRLDRGAPAAGPR